ncbi:PIH1 domain-containing protein Nop17-like [Dermatophagoides farinae]|uniref:Uncharacterized protein n=1 Tax=Dermatophagoides farinae TaxID=6954 RepID=A0A922KZ16_DERFA|nr:protein kintoun-like [Dermatophagoides farinae]KAH7637469.1 hypothetical protein HUG17_8573 [Dermatophagoides farinae]KAH9502082.1 hypothetical protein DERF_012879 [Dermatophagoides farinae]
MQNFNDNPTKNQCIVHPHRQRNDHKLIDFSVDNNDICSKHQNQNNQTDNRTSSGLSTTNKSKNIIIVQRQNKHFGNHHVNDDDYDSAGPIKQTDESSSSSSTASHDDDEPPSTNVGKAVVKQQNGECHSRQITRSIDIQKKNRLRGILKYPPGWHKRTLSESGAVGIFSRSLSDNYVGYYGPPSSSSLESPGILLDCFEYDDNIVDGDEDDDDFSIDDLMKPKKCVTFSEKQATYVFRPGSSILGRRQKNQKKAKKKKERELRKMVSSLEQLDDNDDYDDDRRHKRLTFVNDLRNAIELQRYAKGIVAKNNIHDDDDDDDLDSLCSSTDLSSSVESSSCCDDTTTSASDCSSADEMSTTTTTTSLLNPYEDEINLNDDNCNGQQNVSTKTKKNRRRRRNRKNKLSIKTLLETGGYDSD